MKINAFRFVIPLAVSAFMLVTAISPSCCSTRKTSSEPMTAVTQRDTMTVMNLRTGDPPEITEVIFSRSARIYKIGTLSNPSYLELLNTSLKEKLPVIIGRENQQSEWIMEVQSLR